LFSTTNIMSLTRMIKLRSIKGAGQIVHMLRDENYIPSFGQKT